MLFLIVWQIVSTDELQRVISAIPTFEKISSFIHQVLLCYWSSPPLADNVDFNDTDPQSRKPPPTSSFLPSGNAASSGKAYLWSLNFYAQFFDVDTSSVLHRCQSTLYPRQNFLDVLEGNPDLYGPFWIATTVVMILFLTGTISEYLSKKGEGHFAYDFGLLSGSLDFYLAGRSDSKG